MQCCAVDDCAMLSCSVMLSALFEFVVYPPSLLLRPTSASRSSPRYVGIVKGPFL